MSTKSIVIGIVAIVVVAVAGYFVYRNYSTAQPSTQNQTASSTAATQVQGQDVKVGTGATATPGSVVSVLYVGKLTNGTVFDSSAAHGNQPLIFTLGAPGVIPGFQIGVNGMREGGERLLAIPPSLAYGAQVVGPIPANSILIFDVQLVKVQAATSTTSKTGTPTKKTP